jgi:hypothetical protein
MNLKTRWKALLALLAMLRESRVMASREGTLLPSGFQLRNLSNRRISFWLGTGAGDWAVFRLEPGESQTYQGRDRIWIATPSQQPVHSKLEFGQRYAIKQLLEPLGFSRG